MRGASPAHCRDMPVIGSAASTNDVDRPKAPDNLQDLGGKFIGIPGVQFLGIIQFFMAHLRGVWPQAPDPARPGGVTIQCIGEMRRVRAIDHIIGWTAVGRLIDFANSLAQALPGRQAAIGLYCESHHCRNANRLGCTHQTNGFGWPPPTFILHATSNGRSPRILPLMGVSSNARRARSLSVWREPS